MKTNELKKGDKVILRCGWNAEIADNAKGNIRMATVYGNYTEMGGVYSHDIVLYVNNGRAVNIEHTPAQIKMLAVGRAMLR
jgi:type I site-specific restriction endonuclease